jgi:alpha-1,2-mannosyltransferase
VDLRSPRTSILVLFGLLFFTALFVFRIEGDMTDFVVNYRAGGRLLAGETLYQRTDGHFMFKYFPFSALLYLPLALLPFPAAEAVWFAVIVMSSLALFVVSKRLVSGRAPVPWYVLALPPLVLAKFFFREIQLGQINTVVTLLSLWMTAELLTARDTRAGILWGLATALKPYGLIFLPYFVVRRNLRALASGLAVLALAFLVPALFYGFEKNVEVHREWYRTLVESTPGLLSGADSVSVAAFLTKWSGEAYLAVPATVLLALLVLAVVLRGRDVSRSPVLEVALLLVLIPLVSPLGWDYQFLTSVLAVTLLAHHLSDFSRVFRWLLLANLFVAGFSIYDLMGRELYRAFMGWSLLTVSFLLVVVYLVSLRWRRIC